MSDRNTDLKFFTNEENETLHGRFSKTLEHAKYFDVLVGYFRTSGFNRLYKSLEKIELQILETLFTEKRSMRAGEISIMIDVTYQFIEKRTAKLQQLNLVNKDNSTGIVWNSITEQAITTYFTNH